MSRGGAAADDVHQGGVSLGGGEFEATVSTTHPAGLTVIRDHEPDVVAFCSARRTTEWLPISRSPVGVSATVRAGGASHDRLGSRTEVTSAQYGMLR